uniref:Uncharacterized protein n=1 Tax=Onchocerca volvulus TaxID=6282 RepID=A0A8R1Y0H7_ONCVO
MTEGGGWDITSKQFRHSSRGTAVSKELGIGIGVDGSFFHSAVKYYALWYSPMSCPCHSLLYSGRPPLIQQLGNQYITEYQPIFRPECQPKFVLLHRKLRLRVSRDSFRFCDSCVWLW